MISLDYYLKYKEMNLLTLRKAMEDLISQIEKIYLDGTSPGRKIIEAHRILYYMMKEYNDRLDNEFYLTSKII